MLSFSPICSAFCYALTRSGKRGAENDAISVSSVVVVSVTVVIDICKIRRRARVRRAKPPVNGTPNQTAIEVAEHNL